MNTVAESETGEKIYINDKEITLVGTAHVSKESVELVESVINEKQPDTVCVELCPSRFQSIKKKDQWLEMDIIKVIKEKKSFLLLSNLMLASFQKRIGDKLGVKPGEEMIRAIDTAESSGAEICLADRDITITLSRTWRSTGFWSKMKLLFQLMLSMGGVDEIDEKDIEEMKQADMLESILSEVEKSHPVLREILIDERDRYLAQKIKTAPGKKIVAVVGAGHVPGIRKYINDDINIQALETLPPKGRFSGVLKWLIPAVIICLIIFGFFQGGADAGKDMIVWWVAVNGIFAGIGAIIAFGHPLTILSAIFAAPLTSLNPMIAAGWVSGLVEAVTRKPKVRDLEALPEDILSARGFWRNKVTRILLVVLFTNLGSGIGTFVALPMMMKVLG
ncbi:MAG: TraB/GumN family protein [Desulfobacteraceae bacterium]|nr:TraB/GumN family protein [Desulfobacteraceae bacterium]MBC2756986.1 TraB/GumN family protein [Desulfobacteraceae bacterium]